MSTWDKLESKLIDVYRSKGLVSEFERDALYLRKAFEFTENLWLQFFDRQTKVNIVMLSEAPLFGTKKSYFYNIRSGMTSFFWFNDLEAFYGDNLIRTFENSEQKKAYMLRKLSDVGFLILDIFPFALNKDDTSIHYSGVNSLLYRQLLEISTIEYLKPKLEVLKAKAHVKTEFVYRYKRLQERAGSILEKEFLDAGLIANQQAIKLINGTNMSLNRDALKALYEGLQS